MKRITHLAAGLTALALTAITPVTHASSLEQIQQRGTLRVAVPQDFPPFGSVGTDMQLQGYDIEMAKYLAKNMGVKIKMIPVTAANRIPYLQTDKVDLVISSLGKTAEREKVIDFSKAYVPFYFGVFGLKSIHVTKPADLAGKTVGVTRGALEDVKLSKIAPKSATIQRFEDNNTTLSAFLSGQVDLVATGNVVISTVAKRNPSRTPDTKFIMRNSPCSVGVAKGHPKLLAKVNELIGKAYADGVLDQLSKQWMKAPFPKELGDKI